MKKYKKIKSLIEDLKNDTDIEASLKFIPKDLRDKIVEFNTFIKNYDVEKFCPQADELTGDFFNFENIKERLTKHTGYIWTIIEIEDKERIEDGRYTLERFKHWYNLNVSQFKVYEFFRDSKSRSELWLLNVVLIPWHIFVHYDTGRVSGDTEVHSSLDSLMNEF